MLKSSFYGSVAALAAISVATAGDPAPAAAASPWDVSFDTGLSYSSGNTDSLSLRAGLDAKRLTDADELYFGAGLTYGELDDAVTNESVYAFAQYNKLLSDSLYFGLRSDFLYDDIAALDYRVSVAPLLGLYVIKNDRTTLALEAGAGYQWEDQAGVASEYAVAHFAERFTHEICPGVTLWQTFGFSPELDDFDNYTFTARAGLETTLSERWSILTYVEDKYDNKVAAGIEQNDIGVYTALSYALTRDNAAVAGAKAPAASPSPWDISLAAGLALTEGNSDTLLVTADLNAHAEFSDSEVFLGAGGAYGEVSDTVNAQRAYASAQYNHFISGPFYAGSRTDFLYDEISATDYRVSQAALAGVYLIKEDRTSLAIEAGPAYTFEKVGGAGDTSYFSVYGGERFSHQLNDRVSVFQTLTALLDTDDTDNYILDARAGIDVKLNENISWQSAVQNLYDNQPAAGAKDNDFRLTSGLAIHF